jgi:acylphosphatase
MPFFLADRAWMHGYRGPVKRTRVIVSGHVQGVGFRWICAQEAAARGIRGYVRNLPDGRVEAAFEGDDEAVDGMVEWARGGPQWASVESLDAADEPPEGDAEFRIRR